MARSVFSSGRLVPIFFLLIAPICFAFAHPSSRLSRGLPVAPLSRFGLSSHQFSLSSYSSSSSLLRQDIGSACSTNADCADSLSCYADDLSDFCSSSSSGSCICALPCDGPGVCAGLCGTKDGGPPVCFNCASPIVTGGNVTPYKGDSCGTVGKTCGTDLVCNNGHVCVDGNTGGYCLDSSGSNTCGCGFNCSTSNDCLEQCARPATGPAICYKCDTTFDVTPVDSNSKCADLTTLPSSFSPRPSDISEPSNSPASVPTTTSTPSPPASSSVAVSPAESQSAAPTTATVTLAPVESLVPEPSTGSAAPSTSPATGRTPSPTGDPPIIGDPTIPDSEESDVCIDARLLAHLPASDLVFAQHRHASVLCDADGNCATFGHIVEHNGRPMMMGTYCRSAGPCTRRVMEVNSPRMGRGVRIATSNDRLQFTALSARYETKGEEAVLAGLIRAGL